MEILKLMIFINQEIFRHYVIKCIILKLIQHIYIWLQIKLLIKEH